VKAVRVSSLLLAPLLVPAIILAPILPEVLGEKWAPMVWPLRVLLIVGMVHAVLAIIREFLNGAGFVALSARIEIAWLAGMVATLIPAVSLAGIRGAAVAHAAMALVLAAAYVRLGMRGCLAVSGRRLATALRPLGELLVAQAMTSIAALIILATVGMDDLVSAGVASLLGLLWLPVMADRLQPGARTRAGRLVTSRLHHSGATA
jgi:PST family polysaccharide transporter